MMMKQHAIAPPGLAAFTADVVASEPVADHAGRRRKRAAEQREFKVTVAFLTALFLPFAAAGRLIPGAWRPFARSRTEPLSIFGQAKAAANEIAPFMLSR